MLILCWFQNTQLITHMFVRPTFTLISLTHTDLLTLFWKKIASTNAITRQTHLSLLMSEWELTVECSSETSRSDDWSFPLPFELPKLTLTFPISSDLFVSSFVSFIRISHLFTWRTDLATLLNIPNEMALNCVSYKWISSRSIPMYSSLLWIWIK